MDRQDQDIDALLIGALYGELTPADEARLATHLDSHPGDRGALDDLKVNGMLATRLGEMPVDTRWGRPAGGRVTWRRRRTRRPRSPRSSSGQLHPPRWGG